MLLEVQKNHYSYLKKQVSFAKM